MTFHTDMMDHSPPAGQQLNVNDLHVLMEELNKACVKSYNIGMLLGVEIYRLDAIKEQYNDPSDCLRETLKVWLTTYPSPTWNNIVDALRSSTVGEVRLAAYLEQRYCSTECTSVTALISPSLTVTSRPVPPTSVPHHPIIPAQTGMSSY